MGNCGLRFVYYISNAFYLVIGIIIAGVGISLINSVKDSTNHTLSKYFIPVGVILFAIALLGYVLWCLFSSNCCLMTIYIVIIGLLLLLTIIISVIALGLSMGGSENLFRDAFKKEQSTYDSKPSSKQIWDYIQNSFVCCGIDNRTDWIEYMPLPPKSCCASSPDEQSKVEDADCKSNDKTKPYLQFNGCFTKIRQAQKKMNIIFIVLVVFACLMQSLCFILSIVMVLKQRAELG